MNELLGLYGYEKVAASDIGKIHQHRSDNDSAKELRCREATKSTSPISLQSNPSQSLLSKLYENSILVAAQPTIFKRKSF